LTNSQVLPTATTCVKKYQIDLVGVVETVLKDKLRRLQISAAWPLFFVICSRANHQGTYTTTYRELSEMLLTKVSTLKYWRRILTNNRVVSSYSGGNCVRFCLEQPFSGFLTDDHLNDEEGVEKITFQQAMNTFPLALQRKIIEWVGENPNLLTSSEWIDESYAKRNR